MKTKISFLVCFTIISTLGFAQKKQSPYINIIQTQTNFKWDSAAYIKDKQTINTYDATGNLISKLDRVAAKNIFKNESLKITTFNAKGNPLEQIVKEWKNNKWNSISRQTWTYTKQNNKNSESAFIWEENRWVNTNVDSIFYNADGQLIQEDFWRFVNNSWFKIRKYNTVYNSKKQLIKDSLQLWQTEEGFYLYASDSIDRLENYERKTYTYDSSGREIGRQEDSYSWIDKEWENRKIYTKNYNKNNNSVKEELISWIPEDKEWRSTSVTIYFYDTNGNKTAELTKAWKYPLSITYPPAPIPTHMQNENVGVDITPTRPYMENQDGAKYKYDESGKILSILYNDWVDYKEVNKSKIEFSYSPKK